MKIYDLETREGVHQAEGAALAKYECVIPVSALLY